MGDNENNQTKNYLDRVLNAVEDIIKTKTPDECRENVFETIDKLIEWFPTYQEYIKKRFNKIIEINNVDFFSCIKNNSLETEMADVGDNEA